MRLLTLMRPSVILSIYIMKMNMMGTESDSHPHFLIIQLVLFSQSGLNFSTLNCYGDCPTTLVFSWELSQKSLFKSTHFFSYHYRCGLVSLEKGLELCSFYTFPQLWITEGNSNNVKKF